MNMPREINSSFLISVIIPVFNEEAILHELYHRLKENLIQLNLPYEIIFINDGSKDNTLEKIMSISKTDSQVFYLDFSRNFGHQIAVCAGLDKSKGNAVIIMDGDLQDPPELIPELFDKYKQGIDVVYAKRKARKGETFFKKTTAKLYYKLLRSITNIDIPIDTGDFRLIDRKVVDYLKKMPEQNKFLRGQIAWLGFSQEAVLFDRDQRKNGKTAFTFSKMSKFAIDGITSFSDKPLTIVTKLGFTISIFSFLVILYAVYSHFVLGNTITGWTSVIISSAFIGGVQLLSIGVIGEYISRINKNVSDRPLYIVKDSNLKD